MKIEKEIVAAHHAQFDASPEDYINGAIKPFESAWDCLKEKKVQQSFEDKNAICPAEKRSTPCMLQTLDTIVHDE